MAFPRIVGTAVPFMQINIDTDQIVPGDWMFRAPTVGHAAGLFGNKRYNADLTLNPEFILNREPWKSARILLADRNFGCGSSREEAPMALREFGFRSIIAPSFGSIFFVNCFRNGIVAVELPIEKVLVLADEAKASGGTAVMEVDLEAQTVKAASGEVFSFTSPVRPRQMILKSVDEIGLTLTYGSKIEAFRQTDRARRPWAYPV